MFVVVGGWKEMERMINIERMIRMSKVKRLGEII
jgi:hypothetical protein